MYSHRHQPHHHEDLQSHRNTLFNETDRNSIESQGHHHHHHHHHQQQQHGHYIHDDTHCHVHHCHQTQVHHTEEDEILYNQTPVTLHRPSSSSRSSSSASSNSSFSWYAEANANDPFFLCHAEQLPHSRSCSNIPDIHRSFREYDGNKPIVYATIKHGRNDNDFSELYTGSQKVSHRFSSLDRGHSRSDEGPLQGNERGLVGEQSRIQHTNHEPLYKTASLSRNLAFSEEDILLGVSKCPKRAVSSSQLPSKGILKNKEPHPDIRKAKSMEALSPRYCKGQDYSGQKTQVDKQQARVNFVQEKLQFSAFLDEITKQVLSPSDLTILGVNNNNVKGKMPGPAPANGPIKPQLPPKKQRGNDPEQHLKQQNRQEETVRNSSPRRLDCSSPHKKNHRGSPSPHHCPESPSHRTQQGSNHKDKSPPATHGTGSGDIGMTYGPHFTDGSASYEPHKPKRHYHHMQQPITSYSPQTQHIPKHHPQKAHPGPAVGPSSESSSTKSDSSACRDTASSPYLGHSEQSRGTVGDGNYFRELQEENADLQQNLLQTIVCIESLEVELKRTRDELSQLKEKYQSLLETQAGTKQVKNLLGEHPHVPSVSMSCERQYLLNRVSQLSTELEDAHRTVAVLENINVSCLIKDLLEQRFSSAEAIQKVLTTPAPLNLPATSLQTDSQFHALKTKETSPDWTKLGACPQQVAAFIPSKQEVLTAQHDCISGQEKSDQSPPHSVTDVSAAVFKNMGARYARPKPLSTPNKQQSLSGITHTDAPPNLQPACMTDSNMSGKRGEKATPLDEDVVDITSVLAQQILDEFLQQLQPRQEMVNVKKQQSGPESVDEAGRTAD